MLFTKEWAKTLKQRLQDYLGKTLPSLNKALLYKMLELYQKQNAHNEEVKLNEHLKQKYIQLDKEHKVLIEEKKMGEKKHLESQANWLQFTKMITSMARKLLTTMSSLQGHQRVSNRFLTISKDEIDNFEAQLQKEETAYNDLIKEETTPRKKNKVMEMPLIEPAVDLVPGGLSQALVIDYKKLKDFLANSKDDIKLCAVLQALGWRLTNKTHIEKCEAINEFIANDILSLNHNTINVEKLLNHSNKKVTKYTLILLNELATKEEGANYLIKLIPLLIKPPQRISLIEKLSYRKSIQHSLIDHGVIQWGLTIIKDYENQDAATLESISAILINLLLRKRGREVCLDMSLKALETISLITDIENSTVSANINAALYSLLSVPEQRAEAKVSIWLIT